MTDDDKPLDERLVQADREIRRAQFEAKIRELGGILGCPAGESEKTSDLELTFLERVVAWETGPFSTHCAWLVRRGLVFVPPAELDGRRLKTELWRLIESLAVVARVFLYHTNHLSDAGLYAKLWREVLKGDGPDFARTSDDACHHDFADYSTGADEDAHLWLEFYATEKERREWARDWPDTVIPPRRRHPTAAITGCRCAIELPAPLTPCRNDKNPRAAAQPKRNSTPRPTPCPGWRRTRN